jgi:hypothetical protein
MLQRITIAIVTIMPFVIVALTTLIMPITN